MAKRREFSAAAIREIEKRSEMACEKCGLKCWSRSEYEIDHIAAEGILTEERRGEPLTADDGQLLCLECHRIWKTPQDVKAIAKTKRLEDRPKMDRVAIGPTAIQRRFGV